ncbi:MAG: S-methyl-5-thioribose-1-phosphate isomerase [Spirochaetia bacterium]
MKQIDKYLPFVLQHENIARIEDDALLIGDRRVYPFKKEFYRCEDLESAAEAIEKMVTQGGGPVHVAMTAIKLLAARAEAGKIAKETALFEQAKRRLQGTRPTNTTMARVLDVLVARVTAGIEKGQNIEQIAEGFINTFKEEYQQNALRMAEVGASLIADGDGVMTMCFAETSFILSIALALEQGKRIKVYSPETRPYFQGARLTAPCLQEIGADVTLITDSMVAYMMSQGRVQKYMTAVDIITRDGWAANKVGTFQNAIAAHYHGIPYFPFAIDPDMSRAGRDSIIIEERDPEEVKRVKGELNTREDMQAYYPAFDIVPPHLIAGVITPKGLVSPYQLEQVFGERV